MILTPPPNGSQHDQLGQLIADVTATRGELDRVRSQYLRTEDANVLAEIETWTQRVVAAERDLALALGLLGAGDHATD